MKLDVIYTEDSRQGIPNRLPDNCVDLIATDPQYGWGFMGKDWDRAVPSVDIWRQCFRVLKSGAFAFIMSGPRLDCLIENGMRIREAGFVISFTPIFWCFASGFPKAQNIGKAVDKRNGKPQRSIELEKYLTEKIKEKYQKHTILAEEMGIAESLIRHWTGKCGTQFLIPTKHQYSILKEKLGLDDRFNELIEWEEAKREIIGKSKTGGAKAWIAGFKGGDTSQTLWDITAPATPQAQALDGSYAGFQPKPAVEVVIVAMKSLSEKTYVDQALKNKKGVTWLDSARIPFDNNVCSRNWTKNRKCKVKGGFVFKGEQGTEMHQGRFPANLLVSDDALNDGRKVKSKGGQSYVYKDREYEVSGFIPHIKPNAPSNYADDGSFSRYFSLDAWFEKKFKQLPKGVQKTFPFLIVPKASKAEKNRGCEGLEKEEIGSKFVGVKYPDGQPRPLNKFKNIHPTVKPLKLMSYLITLGSREGDVILDPFIGSGTTAIAARMLGRRYIGFEINKDYCDIAKARLSAIQLQLL